MGTVVSKILFQPPRPPSYTPTPHFFWLYTKLTHKIPAFYIAENPRPDAVTLLFSHGNAEDLGMIYDWFREVAKILHVNVMSYDYTGYGLASAEEEPSEERVYADVEAAYAYLVEVVNLRPSQVVLYGRSLGGGPSTYLAAKLSKAGTPVRGVVLQSPFLSAYRVAFHFRFSMLGDKFCNVDRVGEIDSPVYIIHGTNDEVVPFWNGQELYLAVQDTFKYPPFWVKDAGHNNIELLLRSTSTPGVFFDRFRAFLDDTTARREHWAAAAQRRARDRTAGSLFGGAACCGPRSDHPDADSGAPSSACPAGFGDGEEKAEPQEKCAGGRGGRKRFARNSAAAGAEDVAAAAAAAAAAEAGGAAAVATDDASANVIAQPTAMPNWG